MVSDNENILDLFIIIQLVWFWNPIKYPILVNCSLIYIFYEFYIIVYYSEFSIFLH